MTRLRVMSDLHLEFGPMNLEPIGEDVLVLAGDVGLGNAGACWAALWARQHNVPVVMIAGNHEFYNVRGAPVRTIDDTLRLIRDVAEVEPLFTFLEDETITVHGVTFTGATLWTDYALNGDLAMAMVNAGVAMNDHRLIYKTGEDFFAPADALRRHRVSLTSLRECLFAREPTPSVVMTHHLPSRRSIAERYADNALNAAYASNLDDLVAASGAKLWVHGHTHVSQDYTIGGTRVVCNPRGYAGRELNPGFDPNFIVEV